MRDDLGRPIRPLREEDMLLPTDITPSALGLRWGMSREQCAEVLKAPSIMSPQYNSAVLALYIKRTQYDIRLWFANEKLERISVDLYQSRDFWDGDYSEDEEAAAQEEAMRLYKSLEEQYSQSLGDPRSSDKEEQRTIWDHREGHIQLELERYDREFPYTVRVSSMQI